MCLVCWKGGKISSIFQAYFLSSAVAIHHLTMNDSHRHDQLSSEASIVLSLWLSISGFAAVTGNIVVLWLFYKNESLRRISNRFLASLSVADLLVGLVIAPTWIIFIRWFTFHSVFLEWLWVHTTTATTYNICCISVDRFIAIWFPFRYQEIVTKTRCYTVIILVWLFSLGLPFSTLPVRDKENFNFVMLWISLAFITFVIPLLVVSCFYILIFKSAKKQFYRILAGESPITYNDNFRVRSMKNFKAIKTIGFVLGACIITWMPSLVYMFVDFYYTVINDWDKSWRLYYVVWPWVEVFAFTSSAIDPFLYFFRNKEFRQAFRRTFRWLPCRHSTRNTWLKSGGNLMVRNGFKRSRDRAVRETKLWGYLKGNRTLPLIDDVEVSCHLSLWISY